MPNNKLLSFINSFFAYFSKSFEWTNFLRPQNADIFAKKKTSKNIKETTPIIHKKRLRFENFFFEKDKFSEEVLFLILFAFKILLFKFA